MKNNTLLIRTIILIFGVVIQITAQPNYPKDPEQANLVYSDLENFREAFIRLKPEVDTIQILKTYYFEKASMGLEEFIIKHKLSPEILKEAIQKSPLRYHKISSFIDSIDSFKPKYKQTMLKYKKVIPEAMFPPTYLIVGANRGIAQGSKFGQLVTITRLLDNEALLLKFIVHELSHFQQAMTMGIKTYTDLYGASNNLLGLCLREGGAEFITSLVLGEITKNKALQYLNKNEKELIEKFKADLLTQNQNFWLWESINQKDYPILLGYAMGYKICKSFYEKSKDKNSALHAVLIMKDPDDFLSESSYLSN
jgi:regulator of replication initiation timing